MGKIKKISKDLVQHKTSLAYDIESVRTAKASTRIKARLHKDEKSDPEYVDAAQSKKILNLALKQKEELEREEQGDDEDEDSDPQEDAAREAESSSEEEEEEEDEVDLDLLNEADFSAIELPEEESKALEMFEPPTKEELYETMKKLTAGSKLESLQQNTINHYREVGQVLSHYRSGKVPKSLPPLPRQKHWMHLIQVMNPEKWTAAAMYQVAKYHISSLSDLPKGKKLCDFLQYILLPRIRDDILEYKKLNYYLFCALMKAARLKPLAFYKGIIIALIESGNCTQREARILASIVYRQSIHADTSFLALLKLADMPHSPVSAIFLQSLLAKKYRLKQKVLLQLINHFTRTTTDRTQNFTVLWHFCLLTLCKEYSYAMTPEQKDSIRQLVVVHSHYRITPEILAALNPKTQKEEAMEQ